jgi:hypothetical protein
MNTSLECRGNLDFVLAFLLWDLGCALFVVLTYRLYMIIAAHTLQSMNSGSATNGSEFEMYKQRMALSNLLSVGSLMDSY